MERRGDERDGAVDRACEVAGEESEESSATVETGPSNVPDDGDGSADVGHLQRPLPEKVRQRVVEIAAERLGSLPREQIPQPLLRVARFEPRRRARRAATQIATHLDADAEFRARVGDHVRETQPGLATGLEEGSIPAAVDPVAVAAAAYLLRPGGWARQVEAARETLEREETAAEEAATAAEIARLREQVAATREAGREESRRLRSELSDARAEVADLRRKLREARDRSRKAEEDAREARAAADYERASAEQAASSAENELRKLRGRLADAEAAAEAARRSARDERTADDARLRVLLDALLDAAQGLRRELALPSTISRPADALGSLEPEYPGPGEVAGRGLTEDDPELLDQLLALPQLHLIVDGYNVTKAGYPTLTLETQRNRLLSGLTALVAQSRVEVTCVFDGAELSAPAPATSPRGVRVLFSDPGETADELICRVVRVEPRGRPLVVISSDREIADDVRRSGARPVPSTLLLRRLERG